MNHLLVSYHTCPIEEPGVGLAGGMNVFIRGLFTGLASRGIRTDVLTRGKGMTLSESAPFPCVRIFHVPCGWKDPPSRESAYESLPRFVKAARHFLSENRDSYDAVSAHYWMSGMALRGILSGAPGRSLSSLSMNRSVFMFHTLEAFKNDPARSLKSSFSTLREREETRLARESGRVVFLSRHDFTRTRTVLPALTGKSSIIPPGVDDSFRHPPPRKEARCKAGVPERSFLFLLAARPDPGKNIENAFQAFSALRAEKGEGIRLLVAGQEIPRKALPGGAFCAGAVPHADMPSMLAAADAVLCPSTYESFGLVPLEAMAAGTPPIVPLGGVWGNLVRLRGGGVTYAPGTPGGLEEAMRALLGGPALRKRLAAEGKRTAAEFTWEKCTSSWTRLLSKCAMRDSPR